jgi:hypothetical protein
MKKTFRIRIREEPSNIEKLFKMLFQEESEDDEDNDEPTAES